jgi:pimeloyl-ACP methyl ester carboxylesterase
MKRTACASVLILVSGLGIAVVVDQSAGGVARSVPVFHAMPCPDGVFPDDRDVECGYVRVPEDRAHPHGRQIRVAAAIVHATVPDPAADPSVFLDGGPSFGAIAPFALDEYFAGASYAEDHDLVLVDTRGTGISSPRLGCPELDEAEVEAFYAEPAINLAAPRIYSRALRDCRARLVAAGVDPAAYSSAESAADLEALRRSLGVDDWNLLAISADGTLGLTYMRLFPNGIRSAVIDSGIAPHILWGLDNDRGFAEMLEAIFAGCRANAECHATYPGIRRLFYRLVHRVSRHPLTVTFPDFEPWPTRLRLDGVGLFADAVFQIYPGDRDFPATTHDVLDFMWRVTHGDIIEAYRDLWGTGPVENAHTDDVVAQGKSMSYLCRDMISFITPADRRQAARDIPPFAPRYLDGNYDLADGFVYPFSPAGCRAWMVGRADPVQHRAVRSSIPTLVLSSKFDVGAPRTLVRPMVRTLSRSTYVELPASAHLQLASYTTGSDCSRAIATAFLADPGVAPDTSCVADLPGLDFTPPDATRAQPPRTRLVTRPDQLATHHSSGPRRRP